MNCFQKQNKSHENVFSNSSKTQCLMVPFWCQNLLAYGTPNFPVSLAITGSTCMSSNMTIQPRGCTVKSLVTTEVVDGWIFSPGESSLNMASVQVVYNVDSSSSNVFEISNSSASEKKSFWCRTLVSLLPSDELTTFGNSIFGCVAELLSYTDSMSLAEAVWFS